MSRRAFWWGLAALTLLGAIPRALILTHGLFGDELFTYAIAAEPTFGAAMDLMGETENTPPLTYVVAWAAAQVFEPEYAVRLLSVVTGVLTVPLAGVAGMRAFGRNAGLVGAGLVAFHPLALYYAGEARAYAPSAFAVLLSATALMVALDTGRKRWWATVAVAAAFAVWTHYTAVFPLAAQFAWALIARPDRWRPVLVSHVLAALAYLPWLPHLDANEGRRILALLSPLNRETFVDTLTKFAAGHPYLGHPQVPGRIGVAVLIAAFLAAAIAALWETRLRVDLVRLLRGRAGLFVLAGAATPAGAFLYSLAGDSIWNPRNLLVSLAPALVAVGGLLGSRRAPVWIAVSVAAVAVMAVSTVRTTATLKRPGYDEAAAYLDRVAAPDTPIVEHRLLPIPGALSRHLSAWFERPHRHVTAEDDDVDAAWDAGMRTGRVYVVAPVSFDLGLSTPPEPPGADPRFRVVSQRVEKGLFDLQVAEYAPRRP